MLWLRDIAMEMRDTRGFCGSGTLQEGNLWCSAADGVHCIAPDGTLIGKVRVPSRVSNLCFGDRHHSRLFICASNAIYSLFTNTRGAAAP